MPFVQRLFFWYNDLMRKLTQKTALILSFLSVFFLNGTVLSAQSGVPAAPESVATGVADSGDTGVSTSQQDIRALKQTKFLQNLRAEIRATQKDFQEVTRNVSDANSRLAEVQQRVDTLKSQLENLDSQIKDTEDMILNVTIQINEKESQLIQLYQEAEVKKAALENQKQLLLEYLKTIYEQESGITDTTNDNEQINIAKLLLSNDTVGDQLLELKYFSILEESGHELFDNLENLLNEIKADEAAIQIKKDKLGELNLDLATRKQEMEVKKNAKAHLLEETKGEEKIYQQLLDESVQQQAQVKVDLDTLHENLDFIRKKMAELGDSFNPDEYISLLSPQSTAVYDYINATENGEDPVFHWPVSPSRGISAYFHDPSYVAAFGFAHNAVDIRTPQGTAIRAPADGIVYKVRDNGYGYSYLILAHTGGYMTVYGHVSEFMVEEGDKVLSGQIVGLSGGTPGSKGAGLMTTGPHLHFEVMKGGKYVDPLFYLPINYLPLETLPLKYQSLVTTDRPKVKRVSALVKP
jgi:murein DD-endopeptidase MepM/ murein hydrolase activator NlpD